jgi:secondary thiamine-phosphate synthase enzyme
MIQIELRTNRQTEFVPITDEIQKAVDDSGVENGVCYIYVPHTTAAVTINENADPMVAHDILHVVNRIIPFRDEGYRHMEANSAAHVKACLVGTSETVLIQNRRLVLGTWQGLFFCEFDGPRSRQVYVKLIDG